MDLLTDFRQFILREKLFRPDARLLLAVSGGVDSVVLFELCRQAGYTFQVAHCNFGLRGEESERDEVFVSNLAQKFQVGIHIRRFDTAEYARENKLSIQVAARVLRYEWFNAILKGEDDSKAFQIRDERRDADPQLGTPGSRLPTPHFLLTAHHADDNIETILMNFFKGSGIAGIRGILPKQGTLVRPLLFARKAAITEYASMHALEYVEDSSNTSDKYTRNFFRNVLIPEVRKVFPQVQENMVDNSKRFREIEQIYGEALARIKTKLLETKGEEVHIPVLKLKNVSPLETVLYEITKEYGFSPQQLGDIIGLLDSGTGKYVQSPAYRIIRNRNWLIISPARTEDSNIIVIEACTPALHFSLGTLSCKELPLEDAKISPLENSAQLDAGKIVFPLLLRRRKAGDYFYPLGMQKKKKLSPFLTDLKLSPTEKENTWVLEMDRKIIWVVGYRLDERFRVNENTRSVLDMQFTPNGSK